MGTTQSHEAATAVLGPRQAVHKPYKSTAIPPVQRSHSESGALHSPLSTVCPSRIKLNGLPAGDTTTCCTTTCNSSLSGVSSSPVTRPTGLVGSTNATAITLRSGSPLERSDSAQAVSSIAGQSPRQFAPIDLEYAEVDTKRPATNASRWSHRNRVQKLLRTLRHGVDRSRSQPPPGSSSHEHPVNTLATANESASISAALHAHIIREEEEHRRRRHSSLAESHSQISAPQTEHWPRYPLEPFAENRSCLSPADARGKAAICCSSSPGGSEAGLSLRSSETQEMQVSGQAVVRKACRSRASGKAHRTDLGASRWIADVPTNGRWEMERGIWNRQGVHLNHLNIADERFRALAATRRLSPRQHAAQTQGLHSAVSKGQQGPVHQPRRVPIAPLAGILQENQQRLLQPGQQVMPVTHRGVAAATTIELARSRHANEERRRQQHCLIASPDPAQSTPAPTDTHRKHDGASWTARNLSTGKHLIYVYSVQKRVQAIDVHASKGLELVSFFFGGFLHVTGGGERNCGSSLGREQASARNFISADLHGAASTDISVPAPCFSQIFAARAKQNDTSFPNTSDQPMQSETGDGTKAKILRCPDMATALPAPASGQHRQQVRFIPAAEAKRHCLHISYPSGTA
ncbi:uncharacterized protein EMH_0056580 [Eimeria mitis]|uniref:Uncharacterized protein n=1 Tax=Eimeria mitis TaxID=44415 RepID=U6KAQ0_9EIME|nr:uncharacterized protein EMH_0056580 [Eimeria mitis]CDJ33851.1 hypothetical protein, conserved [Eimeria mitis]